jgi:hypothetical protein
MTRLSPSITQYLHLSLAACAGLAVVLLAAAPAAADHPQIRINSDNTSQLQNEQQIAVNPTDPNNIVACWRDFRLGFRQVGVGYSFDGGFTWTDYLIGGELRLDSDPGLTVHRDGTFYLVVINYQDIGADNQLSVHRSTTGGVSWDGPFSAVYSTGSTFEDKEWIAVDRTGGARDGDLYIAWSRFFDAKVMSVTSTDRGETWSTPVQVSTPGASCQWPVPIVLPNGNVLVAWNTYGQTRISYDISSNGGQTWGTDRTLTSTSTGPGTSINGQISVFPYPSLALDETDGPLAGWLYCVYADAAVAANAMDIWCRRSTDNGDTWSNRVRVNDDPTGVSRDQFHPWVSCDEEGTLHAIWYDRRDDPANYLWHIYYSRSTDGGVTWGPNEQFTDVPSSPADAATGGLPDTIQPSPSEPMPLALTFAGLIGEYSGVAVRQGVVHPIWTDTRNGNQDTYTTVFGNATGLADPAGESRTPRPGIVLSGFPNPAQGASLLRLVLPDAAEGLLTIHHPNGRIVRTIIAGRLEAGESLLTWDGRDDAGHAVPSGVYFARIVGRGLPATLAAAQTKIVLAR